MKNGNCPKGVTAAVGSHATWTRPPKVSTATGFGAFTASRFASPMGGVLRVHQNRRKPASHIAFADRGSKSTAVFRITDPIPLHGMSILVAGDQPYREAVRR